MLLSNGGDVPLTSLLKETSGTPVQWAEQGVRLTEGECVVGIGRCDLYGKGGSQIFTGLLLEDKPCEYPDLLLKRFPQDCPFMASLLNRILST